MKRIFFFLTLSLIGLQGVGQDCEAREKRLLESLGSYTAVCLYNTYGVIGSITDGYMKDAYDDEMVNDLVEAQKTVIDNLSEAMNKLITDKMLKDPSDVEFGRGVIDVLKGLKKQAQLLLDYVKTRRQDKQNAYAQQRKENWSAICKIMGIKEE